MPTCRTEMIFISNLWVTFCAKHDFTVTKRTHAIKLLCKNVVKTFNSKDFFSILVTKYFWILKHFSRFWNSFLDSETYSRFWNFFSIPKYFSLVQFFFSIFRNFFSQFHIFFWLGNIFLDSKIFFSIMKVFSWFWKLFLNGSYRPT